MLKLKDFMEAFELITNETTWINVKTGEIYSESLFEFGDIDEETKEDILYDENVYILPSQHELNEYQDMESFIDSLTNVNIKNELYNIIRGKGAFRKFKDKIYYLGIREKWFEYKYQCLEKKVIQWLEANEIDYEKG